MIEPSKIWRATAVTGAAAALALGGFAATASAATSAVPGAAHRAVIQLTPVPLSSVFVPNATTGPFTIVNGDDGKCLDGNLPTAGTNGSKVQLWSCNGMTIQDWYVHSGTTTATITNREDSKCLDGNLPTAGTNGSKVQLWSCNGMTIQQWTFNILANGANEVVNHEDGKCLDGNLPTAGTNGSKVQLWSCTNPATPIQQWSFSAG